MNGACGIAAPSPRACRSNDFARLSILIVDDDPQQSTSVRAALDALGVGRVEEAGGGVAGLNLLEHSERVFDIVISDLKMAVMDGIAFTRLAPTHKMSSLILVCGQGHELLASAATLCRGYGVGVLDTPIGLTQLSLLLEATPRC